MAKRKKNLSRPVFIALVILSMLAIASYYISGYLNKPSFVHYREFGISLPVNYGIHGIDVSKYQQEISWKDVKEMEVKNVKINFAFIKATEGLGRIDEHFRRNWFNAQKAGVASLAA